MAAKLNPPIPPDEAAGLADLDPGTDPAAEGPPKLPPPPGMKDPKLNPPGPAGPADLDADGPPPNPPDPAPGTKDPKSNPPGDPPPPEVGAPPNPAPNDGPPNGLAAGLAIALLTKFPPAAGASASAAATGAAGADPFAKFMPGRLEVDGRPGIPKGEFMGKGACLADRTRVAGDSVVAAILGFLGPKKKGNGIK